MAHTPGPWEVFGSSDEYDVGAPIGKAHIQIAEVTRFGPGRPSIHNANLIAAAPTMLDVLKLMAENETCVCVCAQCSFGSAHHGQADKIMKSLGIPGHEYVPPEPCLGCQVDAAIKLAEGAD